MSRDHGGVSARLTSLSVKPTLDAFPLKVVSPMLKWVLHETAKGVFSSSVESQFATMFDNLHDAGADCILRGSGGTDAPVGMPGTTQKEWLIPRGVNRIRALDNETSTYSREVYVPDLVTPASRSQYLDDLTDWVTRVATLLNANDKGGHPRWNHCLCFTIPGPETGSEMSLGYGPSGDTVYTNCGTLTSAITAGQMSFALTSPTGPTGSAILQIGTELIHQLSRSGGTVTVGKRGHSGSVAASHSSSSQVKYGSSRVTQAKFNGYPTSGTAPYDHRAVNRAAWATLGSESSNRDAIETYWGTAGAALAGVLPTSVGVSLAGGQVFADNLNAATDVVDLLEPSLGPRLWALTTNLTDDYIATHPNEHAWLLHAKSLGLPIICQTESISRLPVPPTAGAMQRMVVACEDALDRYDMTVLETGRARFDVTTAQSTTAYKGWAGGTVNIPQYLVTAV